jgi:hypothetical protein
MLKIITKCDMVLPTNIPSTENCIVILQKNIETGDTYLVDMELKETYKGSNKFKVSKVTEEAENEYTDTPIKLSELMDIKSENIIKARELKKLTGKIVSLTGMNLQLEM